MCVCEFCNFIYILVKGLCFQFDYLCPLLVLMVITHMLLYCVVFVVGEHSQGLRVNCSSSTSGMPSLILHLFVNVRLHFTLKDSSR